MKKITVLFIALMFLFAGAFAEDMTWKVVAPNGAPALSVAVMAAENPDSYSFITPDTIGAAFASSEADFIIAPVNAGAKLFKAGKSAYKLGAVVTWGNLYFASQRPDFSPEDISGSKLVLFGADTINASVALYALAGKGIEPQTTDALSGAAETKAVLESDPEAIVLTAEPMLTAAKSNLEQISAYSVNDLLKEAAGMDGYAQAGVFIRSETITANPEKVKSFLEDLKQSADLCESDADKVAEALSALDMKFPKPAIGKCAIRFVSAADAREMVEKTALIDISQFGGELPADDFYYVQE